MAGLNFCPFEVDLITKKFCKIDSNNLAYELVFQNGYQKQELDKTILAGSEFIRVGHDKKLSNVYNEKATKIMLREGIKGRKSELQRLLEFIDEEKRKDEENDQSRTEDDFEESEVGLLLDYQIQEDGSYTFTFSESTGRENRVIMQAIPCCPRCHKRLPIGWKKAEDFYGVSLLSNTGEGKTSLLVSLINKKWRRLGRGFTDMTISPAHAQSDTNGEGENTQDQYEELERSAEKMCKDKGECPERTNVGYRINPVFARIVYKGHQMILGIYDNSGEVLNKMNVSDDRIQLLPNLNTHIYLVDPKSMKVEIPEEREERYKEQLKALRVETIEQQGDYQKENRGLKIPAAELLERDFAEERKVTKGNPYEIFEGFRNAFGLETTKKQHMCCTIIKSDLLQESPQMKERENWRHIFDRDPDFTYVDDDIQWARERLVKEVFSEFVFSRLQMKQIEQSMGTVSWHCISALGCSTEKQGKSYYLKGDYDPIRVEEPLVLCLKRRFQENGWDLE